MAHSTLSTIAFRRFVGLFKPLIQFLACKSDSINMATVATAVEPTPTTKDRLPAINEVINKKYRIESIIGDGGYGTVLSVTEVATDKKLAVKTEKFSRSMVHIEVQVLRAARSKECKHFATIFDQGSVNREYVFVVMSLLGRDLHKLRNDQPMRKFSPATAVRIASQTLEALQELHSCGFISRDVKPGNFVIGLGPQQTTIYLIDFGLSRKFVDKNENVIPSRGEVGWRGTARYGSLQAHQKQDLGRKDDIESWLYMTVELWKGSVLWRHLVDREQIKMIKLETRTGRRNEFFSSCPKQYSQFLTEIDKWDFQEEPKYKEFLSTLDEIAKLHNVTPDTPFDWEADKSARASLSMSDRAQRREGHGSAEPACS